jgi:hypothetical protein
MCGAGPRRSSAAQYGEAGERRSVVNDFRVGAEEAGDHGGECSDSMGYLGEVEPVEACPTAASATG